MLVLLAQCVTGAAVFAVSLGLLYVGMLYVALKVLGMRPPGPPPVHATMGDF